MSKQRKHGFPIIGIYCIVNTKTQECYVGQSTNIHKRKEQHLVMLRQKRHHNKPMQKSFNKTGLKYFRFVILETLETANPDLLTEREVYWMKELSAEFNVVIPGSFLKSSNETDAQVYDREQFVPVSIDELESIRPKGYADRTRPPWHLWVYGGSKNPALHGKK